MGQPREYRELPLYFGNFPEDRLILWHRIARRSDPIVAISSVARFLAKRPNGTVEMAAETMSTRAVKSALSARGDWEIS
jgi:hypothetical protein